jgi:erythromycin esterase
MRKICWLIILLSSFISYSFGQNKLVEELNINLIKIKTLSPDSDFNDLSELKPILSDKSIIGLGEATHGSHEFFVFKHRLIKFLVTEENFRIFIIEGDFGGSQTMNEYIDIRNVSQNKALSDVGYGIWMTQEFVELLEWMKDFNATQSVGNKIRFYGCDLNNPFIAANKIKEYLNVTKLLTDSLEEELNYVINGKYRGKLTKENQNSAQKLLQELTSDFEKSENRNDHEFQFVKHCKRELEQYFEMRSADPATRVFLRDKFMAENIEWIYNFEKEQKTLFWAHNEHIKNDNTGSSQKPTGYYLKEKFHNKYYSFGFGFFNGKVMGYNSKNSKWETYDVPKITMHRSTDVVFNHCSVPEFILDFETANSNNLIHEFLNTNLYRRTIGFGYYPKNRKYSHYKESKLNDTFDGLIFINTVSPSTPVKK